MISSAVIPAGKLSSTIDTGILVPMMHSLPCAIEGSETIRERQSMWFLPGGLGSKNGSATMIGLRGTRVRIGAKSSSVTPRKLPKSAKRICQLHLPWRLALHPKQRRVAHDNRDTPRPRDRDVESILAVQK